MKKVLLFGLSVICLSLFAINVKAQNCGSTPQQPGSDWAIPNFGLSVSGSTVTFSSFAICNNVTATPAWSSSNYICNFAVTYRPTATRVFNLTQGSTTFEGTVYTNGNFYLRHLSGPVPGRGTLLNGSYTK